MGVSHPQGDRLDCCSCSLEKGIGLENTDFSESYQNTTGFLSGQSKIYQMTAIQVLNDPDGNDPPLMTVFGIGTDGSTGYVGFVHMPLSGDPTQPLSPVAWIQQPVPMKDAFSSGC
ncbi:hypothetical protein RvY_01337-3 [Ramazzottius varieornatus]|uniref:Uncharacterized protein n=1 Tax=Ramazzottius varieornatus TaxID=947166 RepID=A0A1D1UM23_RAMVA|nr:hypothetical protein RvY_01337-3 [Ramazzottius varieornatus]